jgi:small neutral amino acid transporter SnatA (MarC family)
MRTGILLILGGVVLLITGFWLISKDRTEEVTPAEPTQAEPAPVKVPVKEKPHYEDAVVVYSKPEEEHEKVDE